MDTTTLSLTLLAAFAMVAFTVMWLITRYAATLHDGESPCTCNACKGVTVTLAVRDDEARAMVARMVAMAQYEARLEHWN